MRNKLFKYIRQSCGISAYISANKLTDLFSISNYIVKGGRKKSAEIQARFVKADKAQALYLFKRLNAGSVKNTKFKSIYCLIIPQTTFYSLLA